MASTVERRGVAGSVQTAAAGSSAQTILSAWSDDGSADNAQNRTAIVDLYIEGRGVTTGSVNTYHRRQVYFLGYNRTLARSVGTLLAATEEIEETATAGAVVSLSAPKDLILTLTGPTGGAAEVMDWSWSGDVTITSIPWENPFNILGDLSTNLYQGTMTNMESGDIVVDSPGAGSTHSVEFGGVDEYVTLTSTGILSFERTSSFSISFWFRQAAPLGTSQYAFSKFNASVRGYGAYVTSGTQRLQVINTNVTNGISVVTATDYADDAWHHVVWTYNGSSSAAGCLCYVDGASEAVTSVAMDSLAATIINTNAPNISGRGDGGAGLFIGKLSNVAVYNAVLTLAQAQAIYNAGAPPDLLNLATAANLVYWNRMGD